jgi:hypothetical protein
MSRLRPTVALVAPALLFASACSDSLTGPSRPQIAPIAAEPSFGIFTPLLLPPGAKWGHSFVSFNPDRRLAVNVVQYPDGRVRGRGIFIIPGVGAGTLTVTAIESTSADCVPWGTPCADAPEPKIPESSTVSGVGLINGAPMTFTLEMQSHLWPAEGSDPWTDTDYDTATLTICTTPASCTTTEFYGELHHEPT